MMTSGLVISFKDGNDIRIDNVTPKEVFEGLNLLEKYGFNIGWYILWGKLQVILKNTKNGETQIYLADNEVEGESIMGEVVKKVIDDFRVNEEDQKEIFNILKKHNCCYF